jgi:8-oxo-dGTP pyrophosphatase MutT (NUDIX family)
MPLESGKSRAAFEQNVKTEIEAGKPQEQAVAIAYAKQRGDETDAGQPGDLSPSAPPADGEPLRAAGILFVAEDGQVLLMRRTGRDHAGEWAFPGGGLEGDESAEECARRETIEETAMDYSGPLTVWTRRIKDGVDFTNFVARAEKFIPKLNAEHDLFTWAPITVALSSLPLHPGAAVALKRFAMDELGIAKAIVTGDLVSPQQYDNVLLVAIRITGTGAAYRSGLDEYVWRDASIYLNDEFLQRCQGLIVIWEHPKGRMLNSKEFSSRTVGSVMLPFIRDDEVWGVAKIYDQETAESLANDKLWSTSPGVRLHTSISKKLDDGSHLLIEGKPRLLDHIALIPPGGAGVWDKGLEPYGVDAVIDSQQLDPLDVILDRLYTREINARCA